MQTAAHIFGNALDNDDFELAKTVISTNCKYSIGKQTLIGPDEIIGLYEKNSKEGHQKFDKLVWGECKIEKLNKTQFFVHFKDFLTKNGITHTYQCKQKLTLNYDGKIQLIEHHEIEEERKKLNDFYKKVGLI